MKKDDELLEEISQGVGKKNWLDERYTYNDLLAADLPEPAWFVPGLIPNPGLVAVTGRPGHFKSFFIQWMGMRLAAHLPLFDDWDRPGKYHEPVNVLFIEEEMNARQMKKRCVDMKQYKIDNFHWLISTGFTIKNGKELNKVAIEELRYFVEEHNIKLIILDPFTTCAGLVDENSNSEARMVMDAIRHEFVDSTHGATVIFIHHPAKNAQNGENIRGAGDILGKVDMHFTLEKQGEEPTTTISVKCHKTRYEQPENFSATMVEDSDDWGRLMWVYDDSLKSKYVKERDELKDKILEVIKGQEDVTKTYVAERVNHDRTGDKFKNVWKDLEETHQIENCGGYKWRIKS
ncbi:MAG: AAA family ATPase [Gammaproteobacteria bacterium]|uniref:Putative ATPase domain containing protein n=1 Tax=viral metagenome TaxID=1070528 RepID=A0A6H1ZSC5_9ZZZZ|nr:AAA family ATPase [Gammaproteobacteria bacterium]